MLFFNFFVYLVFLYINDEQSIDENKDHINASMFLFIFGKELWSSLTYSDLVNG